VSSREDFPFAFGEGAADQFKERLKDLMRAQQAAFEEVQAETGGRTGPVERIQVVEHAINLATAGLGALGPRATPEEAADAMGMLFARALAAVQGSLRPSA
jgi:hypothetical protein